MNKIAIEDTISRNVTISIILLVLVVIILLFVLFLNYKFVKAFVMNKFSIIGLYDLDPVTKKESFSLIITNISFNDISISALGFLFLSQSYDFYNNYKTEYSIKTQDKILIQGRDSIKLTLDTEQLKSLVIPHAKGNHLNHLKAFVIDSSGIIFTKRVKRIETVINQEYKNKIRKEKEELKQEILENKIQEKKIKQEAKNVKKLNKKEPTPKEIIKQIEDAKQDKK